MMSRKFASAMIARIPLPLSRWIAKVYLPAQNPAARGAHDGVLDKPSWRISLPNCDATADETAASLARSSGGTKA